MKTTKTSVTILSALASVVLLASCATKSTETQTSNNSSSDNQITMTYDQLRSRENTMSTLWYQKSAETKALYIQGYNVATKHLKELLKTESDKPYSIVLDLDETVLDNSPYQVQNVKDGTAFTPENWDVWVQKAAAKDGAAGSAKTGALCRKRLPAHRHNTFHGADYRRRMGDTRRAQPCDVYSADHFICTHLCTPSFGKAYRNAAKAHRARWVCHHWDCRDSLFHRPLPKVLRMIRLDGCIKKRRHTKLWHSGVFSVLIHPETISIAGIRSLLSSILSIRTSSTPAENHENLRATRFYSASVVDKARRWPLENQAVCR